MKNGKTGKCRVSRFKLADLVKYRVGGTFGQNKLRDYDQIWQNKFAGQVVFQQYKFRG